MKLESQEVGKEDDMEEEMRGEEEVEEEEQRFEGAVVAVEVLKEDRE